MYRKVLLFIIAVSASAMLFSCGNVSKQVSNESNESSKNSETIEEVSINKSDTGIADRTIMYYMVGTDLEENSLSATETISEICSVKYPNNINFIMMTGGCLNKNVELTRGDLELKEKYSKYYNINWEKNQVWKIKDGLNLIEEDFGKDDMTKRETLEKFLAYVKENYPADKYDIIFWDHGGAGLYGFGNDTRYEGTNECLSIKELTEAFENTKIRFNTVGFDACLMASFELMNVLEPYADYLIAAEETSFGSWSYKFMEKLVQNVNMSAVEYGKAIVDAFMENNEANANSLGVFSLNGFKETISESLTNFSRNMNKYLVEDDYLQSLYVILKETLGLGYTEINDIRDLRDFLYWIAYVEEYEFPKELRDSAAELWNKTEPFVIYYRTHKMKYEEGEEKTGGINFVFPSQDVYTYDDDVDAALLSMENYPDALDADFRLMFKLAFLRKALIKELKNNTYEYDDNKVKEVLNEMCERGRVRYKIPKEYIDSIKSKIVPDLAVNRIKSGEGGNIDFEKVVNNNAVSFNYRFRNDITWMIYEPAATARIYGYDGKELKLGEAVLPRAESVIGNELIWTIAPEEDRWFSIKSGDDERVVEFEITENSKMDDEPVGLNYLFDKSISGFVPAILRRYENDYDVDNIIQIHVNFDGDSETGKIIGFTRYDQNANMSAKEMENFKAGDKIVLIANFSDFKTTKNISYIDYTEFSATDLKVIRGYTNAQSVYFKYSIEDIYGEIYECDVPNTFAFELNDGTDACLYASFPSTWTNVAINYNDSSFESMSALGKHVEKLKVDLYDVTNDTIHFGDVKEGVEYPETTVEYLSVDSTSNVVYDMQQGFILNGTSQYLPMLSILYGDAKNNTIYKKYVYFEMNGKKYIIELSSVIDEKQSDNNSYHEMRLIRTALELINGADEKYDYIPMQKVEEWVTIR